MSLAVPADLLEQAQRGEVGDEAFLECVRSSLPYAWSVIAGLVTDLAAGEAQFVDNQLPPPDEAAALAEFTSARSQLLNQRPEFVNC
jgi:hypothetical protein